MMNEYLTPKELANRLKISRVWIYKLVREKKIPFYHIEKCVRFREKEVEEWLASKRNIEWHRDKIT